MYKIFTITLLALSGCNSPEILPVDPGPGNTPLIHDANKQTVPLGGNAWVENGGAITEAGLTDWSDARTVCKTYLRLSRPGKLKVSLFLNAQGGTNTVQVAIFNKSITAQVQGHGEKEYGIGEWAIPDAGYVPVEIRGLARSGAVFGLLSRIGISGTAVTPDISYVKNNTDNYFYWGRRGPSVHLNFNIGGLAPVEWFYSELTVPRDNDVTGSYFMANGFGEGYFGMQVNSAQERRVLFSVWSPYQTDNPASIPADYKIVLLKKGENVQTGEFGNEGSGGQSYLKFNWKAGNTYKFLLQGKPLAQNATVYTAWFFAPEENKWRLIASFKRPYTSTSLKHLYSFLENFIPETGNTPRMAWYGNQWVADTNGRWIELDKIVFTGDDTARKNFRKDYAGGVSQDKFFLKNCGFFNNFTTLDQTFTRALTRVQPVVDFSKLP